MAVVLEADDLMCCLIAGHVWLPDSGCGRYASRPVREQGGSQSVDGSTHLGVSGGQVLVLGADLGLADLAVGRSEEHTSELQSLMRISYAVFCLKKKKK